MPFRADQRVVTIRAAVAAWDNTERSPTSTNAARNRGLTSECAGCPPSDIQGHRPAPQLAGVLHRFLVVRRGLIASLPCLELGDGPALLLLARPVDDGGRRR